MYAVAGFEGVIICICVYIYIFTIVKFKFKKQYNNRMKNCTDRCPLENIRVSYDANVVHRTRRINFISEKNRFRLYDYRRLSSQEFRSQNPRKERETQIRDFLLNNI